VDFTIIPGKGPKILNPIKTKEDVAALKPMHDVAQQVPFLGPILQVINSHDVNAVLPFGFIL
jgi:uroporphyrinogen-III decarboxylase